MPLIPYVIEQTKHGERAYDIYSRILQDRIIILSELITESLAQSIIAQLLFLNAESTEKDIFLYIHSLGGDVYSGLAIYDTMQFIKAPVSTVCLGVCASMAAILLAGGERGKRKALPNASVMIHQPSGGVEGTAADIERSATHVLNLRDRLNRILAAHTGKSIEQIEQDVSRDYYLTAAEAMAYGLIDEVIISDKR